LKKILLYYTSVVMTILCTYTNGNAQLSLKGVPESWINGTQYESDIPTYITPEINYLQLAQEDSVDEKINNPPRFGFANQVQINPDNSGKWSISSSGIKIWQIKIKCPDALSINFLFDKFHLQVGSKLYIYSTKTNQVIGAFSNQNNKGTFLNPRGFGTGLVYGDEVIMELDVPKDYINNNILQISAVVHGYRLINIPDQYKTSTTPGFGVSSACEVNINCPEGSDWQDEKKGVALILVKGNRWCTGSLINNTCRNGEIYFLTANHCLGDQAVIGGIDKDAISHPDASDWTFWWNYESQDCTNPSVEPGHGTTNGAVVVANNSKSDFALLRLTENPVFQNPPLDVYFNGWNRITSPSAGGVGIHHPSGDIKKISTFLNVPAPGCSFNISSHWCVNWVSTVTNYGVTEPGSSGSPIFSTDKKIFGQLHGGPSSCTATITDKHDDYGRFSVSWDYSSTNERQLEHWLDPCNSGELNIAGGYFRFCPLVVGYISEEVITTKKDFLASDRIETNSVITNTGNVYMSAVNEIQMKDGFDAQYGSEFVAEIKNCGVISTERVSKPIAKSNEAIVKNKLYPNPTSGIATLTFDAEKIDNYHLKCTDLYGKTIYEENGTTIQGINNVVIHSENLLSGIYFILLEYKGNRITNKLVVTK
jgi:lysyl endopeptidase